MVFEGMTMARSRFPNVNERTKGRVATGNDFPVSSGAERIAGETAEVNNRSTSPSSSSSRTERISGTAVATAKVNNRSAAGKSDSFSKVSTNSSPGLSEVSASCTDGPSGKNKSASSNAFEKSR
jgi:hypothetical protein